MVGSRRARVQIPTPPHSSRTTLGRLLWPSGPQFPHLYNKEDYNAYGTVLL